MPDYQPTVLFPETDDPAVIALQQKYGQDPELGVRLMFDGMTLEDAAQKLKDNEVDVVIAGVAHDTPTVLRQAIGIAREEEPDKEKRKFISSFFVMEKDGREPIFFADCAVNEYPEPDQLVTIAEQTSESVRHLGYEPVVAFISLSTFGSAAHLTSVQKVKTASDMFKEKNPDVISYGEIQFDAALDKRVFEKKAANAGVEIIDGKMPNVFIFPDGVSGNSNYKNTELLGGFTAVGPMLDGTYRDIHDSSRSATPEALAREAAIAGQLFRARHQSELGQSDELALAA